MSNPVFNYSKKTEIVNYVCKTCGTEFPKNSTTSIDLHTHVINTGHVEFTEEKEDIVIITVTYE